MFKMIFYWISLFIWFKSSYIYWGKLKQLTRKSSTSSKIVHYRAPKPRLLTSRSAPKTKEGVPGLPANGMPPCRS